MIFFMESDAEFQKWLDSNSAGYVVGRNKWPKAGSAMRLHKVSCGFTNIMDTDPYSKACSKDREQLVKWAKDMVETELQECQHCNP